jgi:hypothetical protein
MMAEDALRPIVGGWNAKLKLAWDYKKNEFQQDADEAQSFYNGPYDFLYGWRGAAARGSFTYSGNEDDLPAPAFRMTVNKVAELIQIFGPVLYHRNPTRKVNARKPPMFPITLLGDPNDPNVQVQYQQIQQQVAQQGTQDAARSVLLEAYLNYTPGALDLKTESRRAIDEALIKGMGLLWTEIYQPAGSQMKMAGSFYDTVDNLLIDPDFETIRDAKWVSRKHTQPYWEVEARFGLKPDTLRSKASFQSYGAQALTAANPEGEYRTKQGLTNDLVVWHEIYSKMGIGGFMEGVDDNMKEPMQQYGQYCYLCICEDLPYPLNIGEDLANVMVPSEDQLEQMTLATALPEIQQRLQWPIPFWADDDWPFEAIIFHEIPRKVWPMSHIKPAMGELKFLNWAYSFLAGKIKTACRDFLVIMKSASEDMKDKIKTGQDYTLIELEALYGSIEKTVQFLQHPTFNPEIYKIIQGIEKNFEKRTGLTELAYGMSGQQLRSAQEADVKRDQMNVRPDDMSDKVENAMTNVARKEALAARWFIKGPDVAPVFGQIGATWWDALVVNSNPAEIIHQLEYRIEAGTTRKPNVALEQSNMQQAMQTLFPFLSGHGAATGDFGPVNALISQWAKSMNFDASPFLIQPPPPPPPPPVGAPGPHPGAPAPPIPPGHPGAGPPTGHPGNLPPHANGPMPGPPLPPPGARPIRS